MMAGKGISGPASTPLQSGGGSTPSQGQATSAAAPAPTAAPKGPVDALGDPAAPASGPSGAADTASQEDKSRNPFDVFKEQTQRLIDKKDDIARHEGGGGGIQIRLGHHEGH